MSAALEATAVRNTAIDSVDDLGRALPVSPRLVRRMLVAWGSWVALFTDGPLGTDVGMLPSLAARQLGCRAIRATLSTRDSPGGEARILEAYEPDADDRVLRLRRSIVAIDDGDRWTFTQRGQPYFFEDTISFEDTERYGARSIRERFTAPMLHAYLNALGVDPSAPLALGQAILIETSS
jgi:hypothetical protein